MADQKIVVNKDTDEQFEEFLLNQFGSSMKDRDNDHYISFQSQDAEYKVKVKNDLSFVSGMKSVDDADDGDEMMQVTLEVRHVRTGKDDVSNVVLCFDKHGGVTSFKPDIANGRDEVQDALGYTKMLCRKAGSASVATAFVATATIDGALMFIGTVFGPATIGGSELTSTIISIAATAVIVEVEAAIAVVLTAISTTAMVLSALFDKIADFSDDGGTAHFPQVVAHAVARAQTAYIAALSQTRINPSFTLSNKAFKNALKASSKLENVADDKDGEAYAYDYKNDDLRTWKPDVTYGHDDRYVLVSIKIDGTRDNRVDDHVLLLAAFDPNRNNQLMLAQCVITMANEATQYIGPLTYDANNKVVLVPIGKNAGQLQQIKANTLEEGLASEINRKMSKMDHYDDWKDSDGLEQRRHFDAIVSENLTALQAAISRA